MGVAKVEYYGRTLIDLTGDSVNPDVLAEGETAHDANGDLIVGRGVLNKGNFANSIVGNVSGEIVAMDDVSPLEHKVSVKTRSKNLFDISKIPNDTNITIENGIMNISGTNDSLCEIFLKDICPNLKAGDTVVLSFTTKNTDGVLTGSTTYIYLSEVKTVWYNKQSFTVTQKMLDSRLAFYTGAYPQKYTEAQLYDFQIELGTTATAYTPYVANDEVITVRSCGKNLIPFPYRDLPAGTGTKTVHGVTFTIHDDGTITTSGTSTSQSYFTLVKLFLPVGTYRLSGCIGSMPQGAFIYFANKDYSVYKTMYGSGITIEVTKADIYDMTVNFNNGVVADGLVFKPQLEIGTTTTDHEPCKEGEEIITTFAELAKGAELTSIAPNMTIYTDKAGAIVECSYNKDTNIVIEKLTQAIIALGGNV